MRVPPSPPSTPAAGGTGPAAALQGAAAWAVRPLDPGAIGGPIPLLAKALDLPALVAQLLWVRGVTDEARARWFLRPRMADLLPPESLPDAAKAAERLARALTQGETVGICGDYDVDGMTGTALLVRFLRLCGGKVLWSIPQRARDGYGLSPGAVQALAAQGASVLITVDNGVTAHAALECARELGVDVIVTDHHLPGPTLPPAYAIVNPQLQHNGQAASVQANGGLPQTGGAPCGCTLAFKLAWAVADRVRARVAPEKMKAFLRDAVALAALATVADVMPLHGENRILVSAGLQGLRESAHPGLQALLEVAQVGSLPLTTEDVSFRIAPRLNAAGRMSKPAVVVDLLTEDDPLRARRLALELDSLNKTRRSVEQGVLREAEAQAAALLASGERSALVVYDHGWHVGVVGIVAARLVDRYQRPAVVIGFEGDVGRGSCRTVPQVNVHAALTASCEHLLGYGGHPQAAGLEIHPSRAERFRAAFETAVHEQAGAAAVGRVLDIDAQADVDGLDLALVQHVRRLGPFGEGNPEPRLLLRSVLLAGRPKLLGSRSAHLSFALRQAQGAIRVVAFQRADLFELAASGCALDLVVTPVLNEWRGTVTPELRLIDMRRSDQAVGT